MTPPAALLLLMGLLSLCSRTGASQSQAMLLTHGCVQVCVLPASQGTLSRNTAFYRHLSRGSFGTGMEAEALGTAARGGAAPVCWAAHTEPAGFQPCVTLHSYALSRGLRISRLVLF